MKINVNDASGKQNSKYKAGSTVALNEPVFIAKPNSSAEDDGVLIIRGLDVGSEKGVCFCRVRKNWIFFKNSRSYYTIGRGIHVKRFSKNFFWR